MLRYPELHYDLGVALISELGVTQYSLLGLGASLARAELCLKKVGSPVIDGVGCACGCRGCGCVWGCECCSPGPEYKVKGGVGFGLVFVFGGRVGVGIDVAG